MDKRTILLQAGIDTPAKFFEVYGWYDNLDTGLGEGFNFDNPLEPSPSTARTGSQAIMAYRDDWNSLLEGAEGYDSLAHSFTDGGEAFWLKCVKPVLDAEKPPVELGWGQGPEYSDLEEEVSGEEETDSEEDRRPARSAWKRPVGNTAGSVEGQGEWHSSDGVPLADAPEWQQDEDDEEFEGGDDEYGRPARLSVAPAPTVSSRKASAWSEDEDAACIKLMKEVCTLAQYAAIAGTEKRFEVVANRMKDEAGFNRTASGVKLQWNRRLRAASGFEDRGEKKRASGLTTSALSQGTKRGTSAATSSVSSNPARGKKSSATSAQSTETGSLSGRQGKRKAIYVDSDDEDDDDFSAPRPYPAKRPRTAAASSSSTLPSTQDVAYYDLSAANILSGPRSTRHRPATTTNTTTTTTDDEEEAIPPSITPEPNHNSLAYWQDVLRQRQAKLAKQREEAERQQEDEEESEDEEPIITTADRSRMARERRKQKTPSTTKSASTTRSSSTTRSYSATRPASTTRPTSATTSSSTTGRGLSYSEYLRQGLGHIPPPHPSTTRSSARRFNLSPIVEDAEPTTLHTTPAAAAQIAADEEIARRMQEEWNEAPAPRSRRGRGFR